MINKYVPQEIVFEGKTYLEGVQIVPQELVDYIDNHPQLSKIQPPKAVDKFAHLKRQRLAYIQNQLADYEADLAARAKVIEMHLTMGGVVPKNILAAQKRILEAYQELKAYVEPLMRLKASDEAFRRSKILSDAQARGSVITFDKDGNYSESYIRETFKIGGN